METEIDAYLYAYIYTHTHTYICAYVCVLGWFFFPVQNLKEMSRPEFQNGVEFSPFETPFQPMYNALGSTLKKVRKQSPLVILQ